MSTSPIISVKSKDESSIRPPHKTQPVKNREKVLSLLEYHGVRLATSLEKRRESDSLSSPACWQLSELRGRLVELSSPTEAASSALTLTLGLVAESQRSHEMTCWVTATPDSFFPPDAVRAGVDLSLLPIIRIPREEYAPPAEKNKERQSGARGVEKKKSILKKTLRSVDLLARSGAFAMVIVDLGRLTHLPAHALSRLKGLAYNHGTTLLFLTQKSAQAPSLDSLISLRGVARRERVFALKYSHSFSCRLFRCLVECLKDKRRGPGWQSTEICAAPPGLR